MAGGPRAASRRGMLLSMEDEAAFPAARGVTRAFRVITLVWLLWLAYPIADLATRPRPALAVAAGAALLAGFVAAYLRLMLSDPFGPWPRHVRLLQAWVVVAALVGAAAFGEGWGGLAVYAATTLAVSDRPGARTVLFVLALSAANTAAQVFGGVPPEQWIPLSIVTAGVGASVLGTGRLIGLIYELRAARAAVARLAVTQERERFARDLHDLLGHSLSLIALKSGLASRLLPAEPGRAAEEIADVERVARDALAEVRDAVEGYRDPDLGRELARAGRALAAAGVDADIDPVPPLPEPVAAMLAWAVREGVTNVVRHAGAGRCRVALRVEDASAALEVHDDGAAPAATGTGTGLSGLRERLDGVGGRLEAGRTPGGGFRLRAEVPLPSPAPACP
jgi:two-component system sensor histidine kinase DesK